MCVRTVKSEKERPLNKQEAFTLTARLMAQSPLSTSPFQVQPLPISAFYVRSDLVALPAGCPVAHTHSGPNPWPLDSQRHVENASGVPLSSDEPAMIWR